MPDTKPLFVVLDSVDSTNNYAMAKVHAGLAKQGDAYFSFIQTDGKGQRGKNWHTGNRQNIALSIVIVPSQLYVNEQFKLSAAVALACVDFFSQFAGEETKIKWPNDIYWRDRKAGGVLIENVIGSDTTANKKTKNKISGTFWKFAVVGIGININQAIFNNELSNAISLKQITGKEFEVTELAKQLHLLVLQKLNELSTQPFEKILQQYNERLFKKNEVVRLKKDNIIFATTVKEVTANGLLFTTDLIDNFFDFGEVEWLL